MVETGHFALVLAFALALVQTVVPLFGARTNNQRLMAVGAPVAITGFALTALSFAALVSAYASSDFSVASVWENSHSLQPMIYKITGTWGNHEGSMLLWVLILTFFGALVAAFGSNLPATLRANVLAVQGAIGATFFLFILATSNPFARLSPAPIEGRDLNPILQDLGLAVHPPLLYLGYVGFSICFSFSVAALIDGRIDASWARWVRPWTLVAWMFLTGGIAMGSYWAYYELGWGGFWFWDPVENASFMPWLAGTALLHSAIVMEKRSALKIWTLLLAILTFSLSLLGTFLVRSGVLTSVHAFATDPTRGIFILCILTLFIGGSLTLFALRASRLTAGGLFHPVSREGALVLNNLFLTTATATVLVGTLYPLAVEALSADKISVGAPFFDLTFGPLMVPLLAMVPFGPLLAWKRGDVFAVAQRLMAAFAAALLATLVTALFINGASVFAALGVGLAVWLILGALTDLAVKAGFGNVAARVMVRRLLGLPRSVFGTALAHLGLGLTTLGIVGTLCFGTEKILSMHAGQTVELSGHTLRFVGLHPAQGPNYSEDRGRFQLIGVGGSPVGEISSAKRFYPVRQTTTTESGIRTMGLSQLYISLGDEGNDGSVVVRLWWKPLVTLIWGGGLVMMVGAAMSLMDRRLRVGAPSRRRKQAGAMSPAGLP
ncbi:MULTISPECIES: heme lyase CcmF/NrfE family subunit [unclassified Mesorhizobium]|uniref:heme lyase CcmF/NrfE family subunit n=1 Tax=unclassified Mesorhizobium TaxID=325217 RepID=UPI00112E0E33|nr:MULTISPECIES: heme lyase CcmF/NrfE family subunit [unclassified Mesorhizobium]TPJ45249.1 heme lyase CcmF/NrfE family subunit [Mesorhizobium sp. B2-6-6]MBZ9957553.1 heme lyase CcmF/NrfE family subunit [Mesorhizobium sp. BR1-1-14]MBZ9982699.1 heme lyase CcmF/NrfE family subunit [Mesorhizobium sp. BR-1-1-8]MCA0001915.1 heme lyase CcmF/NrfE family subunit [Mesorhizobium sp. B264B2A]MCA0006793.1 heme lyase CcmF/NrfE family subunit [Mesorhizobium sp. B264B1B]